MTPNLALATFYRPNFLFAFFFRHRRNYDEQNAVVVVKHCYQRLPIKRKRASTQKYFRGMGNLCLSAAYINFLNTISCGSESNKYGNANYEARHMQKHNPMYTPAYLHLVQPNRSHSRI